MSLRLPFIALGLGTCLMANAVVAHAESVVWSKTEAGKYVYSILPFVEPNMSIMYGASVRDALGNPVGGQTIPQHSCISLDFKPHVSEDISWFGTGYTWDSPYGDWVEGGLVADDAVLDAKNNVGYVFFKTLGYHYYVAFGVEPPVKNIIAPPDGFSCSGDPSSHLSCCAQKAGSYDFTFHFAPTIGKFKGGWIDTNGRRSCGSSAGYVCPIGTIGDSSVAGSQTNSTTVINSGSNLGFNTSGPEYALHVPEQTISVQVNVVGDGSTTTPPTQPSLSASGGAACVVGTPYSISMTSTDLEGDSVRYLIDWNADGSVDHFIPGSGYVPSGTSLTASRTYATEGQKTLRVRAQDENGNLSTWATFNFTCAGSAQDGFNETGNRGSSTQGGPVLLQDPLLELRVIPSLVRSGNTTKVNWSASNVQSCTVTAPNGDAWSKLFSIVSGELSRAINSEITYTLRCLDDDEHEYTKTATVRVLPTWRER